MLTLAPSGCVTRSHNPSLSVESRAQLSSPATKPQANDQQSANSRRDVALVNQINPQRININTASANELETLPGIGKGLAERIIDHRERFGPFRRTQHLIIVRGISDKRFRALRNMVTVE